MADVTETFPATEITANQKGDVQSVPTGQDDSWVAADDMNKLLQFATSLGRAVRGLAGVAALAPATAGLNGEVFRLLQIDPTTALARASKTHSTDLNKVYVAAIESIEQGGDRDGTASNTGCFGIADGLISLASGAFPTSTLLSFDSSGTLTAWASGAFAPIGIVLNATTAYVNFNRRFIADNNTLEFFSDSGVPTLRVGPNLTITTLTATGAIQTNTHYKAGTQQVLSAAMAQIWNDITAFYRINHATSGTPRSDWGYNMLADYAFWRSRNGAGTALERFLMRGEHGTGAASSEFAMGGALIAGYMLAMYGNQKLKGQLEVSGTISSEQTITAVGAIQSNTGYKIGASTVIGPTTDAAFADISSTGFISVDGWTELTISGGVITAVASNHVIDTEGDAATDDLDTINGAADGKILIIRAANSARDIVCKDATGNLQLAGGDFTMDTTGDTIMLLGVGSWWVELSRSNNS